MAEELTLTHERVDDIPLLIGLAQKLHLPKFWTVTWATTATTRD
jgi:hypothetical protein